jgi:hypothetical protein
MRQPFLAYSVAVNRTAVTCNKKSPPRHEDTEKNIKLITWLFCSVPPCLCGDPCLRTCGRAQIPRVLNISVLLVSCENHHAIGRNDDRRGCNKAMQRAPIGLNAAPVPGDPRIDQFVIHVAVEHLCPPAGGRKAQFVVVPGTFGDRGNHDHIQTRILEPPMKAENTIRIRRVECVHIVASQRRLILPKPDQILGKAEMIRHGTIGTAVQTIPPQQVRAARVRVPGLSSRNSWPMKSWGIPGAVSKIEVANRLRLRAYQER